MRLGEIAARHPFDLDAAAQRLAPLFADRLALARGERARKSSKLAIAFVLPMELLVGALEETQLAGKLPFVARGEGDMQRGHAEPVGDLRGGLRTAEPRARGDRRRHGTSRRLPVTGVNGTEACSFG